MKHRFAALALAGVMTLSLCACGGKPQPTAGPSQSVTAAPEETAAAVPTESAPTEAPTPSQETEPAEPSGETPTPSPIGDPTAPPSEEPSEEPRDVQTAAQLREFFMLTSSKSDAPTSGFSDMADYLENFYNLSADDLADFVFYMPDMSTALQEFFLARAKEGKVETVKAACESRLQGLKEEAEFYPGTADFVDSAKVEAVGDWVVLAVCPEAGRMGKILQDVTQ